MIAWIKQGIPEQEPKNRSDTIIRRASDGSTHERVVHICKKCGYQLTIEEHFPDGKIKGERIEAMVLDEEGDVTPEQMRSSTVPVPHARGGFVYIDPSLVTAVHDGWAGHHGGTTIHLKDGRQVFTSATPSEVVALLGPRVPEQVPDPDQKVPGTDVSSGADAI